MFAPRGGTTCRASDRLKFASQLLPGPLWAGVDHVAMSRKEGLWLVCHQAASQKPSIALVCLPWAGGQAAGYKKWMEHIHPRIELWAAALPGREKRLMEPPVDDIHVAVAKIAQVRVQHQRGCVHGLMLCLCTQAMKTAGLLARPFAIFGHSMGSLLACVAGPRRCPRCSRHLHMGVATSIELTRLLASKYAASPVHVFVGAMRAPNAPIINRKLNYLLPEPQFIEHLRKVGGLTVASPFTVPVTNAVLVTTQLGGTPPEVLENRELMELFMPMLRADFKMVDDYCSGTRGAGRQAGKLPAGQVRLSYAGYVWSQRKARRWTALSHPCLARTT